MSNRVGGIAVAALSALTVVALLSACTGHRGAGPGGLAGSGAVEDAPAGDEQAVERRGGRAEGEIELGDLNKPKPATEVGAPFDPCALSWSDFPLAVRPTDGKPHTPTARSPQADDPFDIRCLYDNSGSITLDSQGNSTGQAGGVFMVSVVWSESKLDADPRKRKDATAKSWNNRAGLVAAFTDRKHGKACLGLVTLSKGVAGASVTNSRFKIVDPCDVVDAVLNAVTAKAS